MTDNEIIKALECCASEQYTCGQCPYQETRHYDYDNGFEIMPNGKQYDDWSCDRWLMTDLIALINRLQSENDNYSYNVRTMTNSIREYQKAIENYKQIAENQQSVSMDKEVEIKRLKAEVERLEQRNINSCRNWQSKYNSLRAEAVKEFADRFEKKLVELEGSMPKSHIVHKTMQICKAIPKMILKEMGVEGE